MRIAIVGGGLTGFALAHRLGIAGHGVRLFERALQPGGLSTWQDYGGFSWDRFYHVVLPGDAALLSLFEDIGLADAMRWRTTRTGYYANGRCHSFDSLADFMRFPLLSPWGKLRLGAQILYCSRTADWQALEHESVEDFLVRTGGREVFETFWKPLLRAKLGNSYPRVSAVFIWSYVRRMFSARSSAAHREQLGHVRGGYKRVFEHLQDRICAQQGDSRAVALGVEVQRIEAAEGGGLRIRTDADTHTFDKIICTAPVNVLRACVEPELVALPAEERDIEYLGVVCPVLVTRAPIVPYYVLNVADEQLPFTGVIGMGNVVDPEETAGMHLTYLPKYTLPHDPLMHRPDEDIGGEFVAGVERMLPRWDRKDLVSVHVHRAPRVQPLQVLGYSSLVGEMRARHSDLYLLNTAQFVSGTLNNNEAVRAVNEFLAAHAREFAGPGTH